jgi:hypothetical protein
MATKNNGPQWEAMFDQAAAMAADRHLAGTLSKIKRIRGWQHRQPPHSAANNSWHHAELLYLEALVLERARHFQKAKAVRTKLAELFLKESRLWGDKWFLPWCRPCASRSLGFAPNWYSVAVEMRTDARAEGMEAALQASAASADLPNRK